MFLSKLFHEPFLAWYALKSDTYLQFIFPQELCLSQGKMGVIEELFGSFSLKPALLVLVVGYVLYRIFLRIEEHTKLSRLGARAPELQGILPFSEL